VEYCAAAYHGDSFKELLTDGQENYLWNYNHGGLFGGGVCWWHSRLERSATYLSVFRPDLPKAGASMARWIIENWVDNSAVVEVPGYRNLEEFSRDYESMIQSRLQSWQREEGILKFAWIKGLKGAVALTPDSMKSNMDYLYADVMKSHRMTWVKIQVKGIGTHAWLIVSMTPVAGGGYDLVVADSNRRGALEVQYRYGDSQLSTSVGMGVPTLGEYKDFYKVSNAVRRYCGQNYLTDFEKFVQ
jgi:hypothetical protein